MPRGHHYAWGATFEKVDETIAQNECEHNDKPQFNKLLSSIKKWSFLFLYFSCFCVTISCITLKGGILWLLMRVCCPV